LRLLINTLRAKRVETSGGETMRRITKTLKTTSIVLCSLVALVGTALGLGWFDFWLFLKSPGSPSLEIRQVTIRQGMNARNVAQLLFAEGIVTHPEKFYMLCWLRKAGQKIKAGDYAFLPLSTPDQILAQMVRGRAVIQRVTLPEGSTVYDIARTLEDKGLGSSKEVLRLVGNHDFIKANGLNAPTLEGYLFPETYFIQRAQGEAAMLKMMVHQFWRHLPEGWEQRSAELGFNLHEIVTMASMVEKEAAADFERSKIAGVFYNRLKRKMPLQSDPTAVYDLSGFSGPISGSHLKRPSPYNTYQNPGLPIGPICNPGAKSLAAALYPEQVSYLYFVSNRDGTHQFSETLVEHNKAVSRSHWKARELPRGGDAAVNRQLPGSWQ
jgi:UPF0755 protein